MAHEQQPADNSDFGIDPELISFIDDIETEMLQPGDEFVEVRVFQDYYNELQEVSSEQLRGALIEYTDEEGLQYQISAVGPTPFGQLCSITQVQDREVVASGYAVLSGSLVLNALFDDLSDEEKTSLAIIYNGAPKERNPIKLDGPRYAVYTKGLCQDSYFIFMTAEPIDDYKPLPIGIDGGFSEPERGAMVTVRLYGSGEERVFFVHANPIITEEKVQEFTVCEPQEDTVVYHYIG